MVPFWPDMARNHSAPNKALNDFAQVFDSTSKVVFSHTLGKVDDSKTTIINTDLKNEILKLKQQPGKYMLTGGVHLPSQLIELDLIDEYRFVVHPIVAGEGTRLLKGINLPEKQQLKLVASKVFSSGCIALHYVKQ